MIAVSALAAVIGAAWGSFLGVVVGRVPSGGGVGGRSRCDSCGETLGAADLVPVVSWALAGGRCRHCKARITARWTVLEVGCGVAAVSAVLAFPAAAVSIPVGLFLGVLLALAMIDLEHHRLPNAIVYPASLALAVWICLGAMLGAPMDPVGAAIGAASFGGGLLLVALVSRGGMGLGDVKLAGAIGMMVGAVDLPSVAVAAAAAIVFGGLTAVWALLRGAGRRSAIPFGPMLSLGTFVALLAGPRLAEAYMGLVR